MDFGLTNILGDESSRTNLGVVAFLGIGHESLLNVSVLQRVNISNVSELLEVSELRVLRITDKIIVGLKNERV